MTCSIGPEESATQTPRSQRRDVHHSATVKAAGRSRTCPSRPTTTPHRTTRRTPRGQAAHVAALRRGAARVRLPCAARAAVRDRSTGWDKPGSGSSSCCRGSSSPTPIAGACARGRRRCGSTSPASRGSIRRISCRSRSRCPSSRRTAASRGTSRRPRCAARRCSRKCSRCRRGFRARRSTSASTRRRGASRSRRSSTRCFRSCWARSRARSPRPARGRSS